MHDVQPNPMKDVFCVLFGVAAFQAGNIPMVNKGDIA